MSLLFSAFDRARFRVLMSSKLQFECSKVSSGKPKLCSGVTLNTKQGVLAGVQMRRVIYRIEAPDVDFMLPKFHLY